MIHKKQWSPNSPNLNSMQKFTWKTIHEAFLKALSEAKTVSELKVARQTTWKNFPENKAVPSFKEG